MVEELKKKVEAILFSAGSRMQFEEIRKLCRARDDELKLVLEELKHDYEGKDSSIMLVQEGDFWKLTIREKYLNVVRRIVTQTELTKSIMETLAVIAWKYPVVQSEVIKIRTNKAYDHLNELEQLGYISRQKYGRTKLIKLTQKFFDYFDLPEDKLKEVFKDFTQLANAIEKQEVELEKKESQEGTVLSKEQQPVEQNPQQKSEIIQEVQTEVLVSLSETKPEIIEEKNEMDNQPEINLFDSQGHKEKLKVFEESESSQIEIAEEKLGELEVVDELPEENTSKESAEEYDTEISPEQKEQEEAVEKEVEKILKPLVKEKLPDEKSGLDDESDEEKSKKSKEEQDVDNLVDEIMHPKKADEEPPDDER
jgi:segregation and condensation protein B